MFSGTEHLVGYSGKVSFKKLKPLKRSRTDKIREKSLEQDYLDRVGFLNAYFGGQANMAVRLIISRPRKIAFPLKTLLRYSPVSQGTLLLLMSIHLVTSILWVYSLFVLLSNLCELIESLTAGFTLVQESVHDRVSFTKKSYERAIHSAEKTKLCDTTNCKKH